MVAGTGEGCWEGQRKRERVEWREQVRKERETEKMGEDYTHTLRERVE